MLSPNYNNFIQHQQQKQPQQIAFQNSFDSANGSFNNSSSLLTAANTLTFNSPQNNNNVINKGSSDFSKTLQDMRTTTNYNQNSNHEDLDFDLHYNNNSISSDTSRQTGVFKNDVEFLEIGEEEEFDDNDQEYETEREYEVEDELYEDEYELEYEMEYE